jgi:hypothetical protein
LHALVEASDHELVVWLLGELKLLGVLHVLLETRRKALAQLTQRGLHLLLLDVVVLLVLGPSR